MNPREKRLLKILSEAEKVEVKELRATIGALNPAQVKFSLMKKGWNIQTGRILVHDRDGKTCYPGFYYIESSERDKARLFLEKIGRAAGTALPADNNFELESSKLSNLDDSSGGEK